MFRIALIQNTSEMRNYSFADLRVPLAEMGDYVTSLRAITQGRGRFDYEFARYEEVPANIAEKLIAEAKARQA